MGIKVICFVFFLIFDQVALSDEPTQKYSVPVKYNPIEYLKNYALSACIAEGYKNMSSEAVIKDASAVTNGYFEYGDFPIEAYNETADAAKIFLKRKYPSKFNQPLILMKCIDFYHSRELEGIIKKYTQNK